MFSIFGALIGGGCLAAKFSSDNIRSQTCQQNYSRNQEREDVFMRQYAASMYEMDSVKEMIEAACSQEVIDLEKELTRVIGIEPTYPMFLWGHLARQYGKIPEGAPFYHDYRGDGLFEPYHDNIWSTLSIWKKYTAQEIRAARLKFLKWYNQEMKKHGMKYELMYIRPHYEVIGKGSTASPRRFYNLASMQSIATCTNLCPTVPCGNGRSTGTPVAILWEPLKMRVPGILGTV